MKSVVVCVTYNGGVLSYLLLMGLLLLKGPIHDQSCCAKLFCATQVCPFTINRVAQHAMLRNMIDRVWAHLDTVEIILV
jgi:hypothetical protein